MATNEPPKLQDTQEHCLVGVDLSALRRHIWHGNVLMLREDRESLDDDDCSDICDQMAAEVDSSDYEEDLSHWQQENGTADDDSRCIDDDGINLIPPTYVVCRDYNNHLHVREIPRGSQAHDASLVLNTLRNEVGVFAKFVCGFAFYGRQYVALLIKSRPANQYGKLNGIGGHVKVNEDPIDAMIREFREETGMETDESCWAEKVTLTNRRRQVHFFAYHLPLSGDDVMPTFAPAMSTDEPVFWYHINDLRSALPDLTWLIPMCLDDRLNPVVINDNEVVVKTENDD